MAYPHVSDWVNQVYPYPTSDTLITAQIHNMAGAGEVLAGPIGQEIGGAVQNIFLIFSMAAMF